MKMREFGMIPATSKTVPSLSKTKMHMKEGLTEIFWYLGIATAICGLTAWMVSTGSRYSGQIYKGASKGIIFGLFMLLPVAALMPLRSWPLLVSDWAYLLWMAGVVLYESTVWILLLKCRASKIKDRHAQDSRNGRLAMISSVAS